MAEATITKIQYFKKEFPNVTNYRSRSALTPRNRIPDLVLGTNTEQSHQVVLRPGDALRSSGNPRILVLRSSSDSLTEMAVGKDEHSYGCVAQRQEANDSKSLQGVFESLRIHQRLFIRVALLALTKTETLTVGKDRHSYADIVLAVSTVVFQTTGIGSNPIICSSRPRALTHSPTPGSKKCAVLSKGF